MGRLFPESATLAPEIHSQNTWDKILNRTGVIIKVLFVTSYICHSIMFHLVLFFSAVTFFSDRRTVSGGHVDILPTDPPRPPPPCTRLHQDF